MVERQTVEFTARREGGGYGKKRPKSLKKEKETSSWLRTDEISFWKVAGSRDIEGLSIAAGATRIIVLRFGSAIVRLRSSLRGVAASRGGGVWRELRMTCYQSETSEEGLTTP